jgi:hypothetical protein
VVRTVTVIMGTVVGLTFLFGFGNVLNLALRLGVPVWVAPLVAPAVDLSILLSILGLLLGTRHLALHGATPEHLRPARRLLTFANLTTRALNIADPIVTGTTARLHSTPSAHCCSSAGQKSAPDSSRPSPPSAANCPRRSSPRLQSPPRSTLRRKRTGLPNPCTGTCVLAQLLADKCLLRPTTN